MIYRKCRYCGKTIGSQYPSTLRMFCSHKCSNRWKWENIRERKEYVVMRCAACNKELHIDKNDHRIKDGQINFFCDHKCESIYRKSHNMRICPICGKVFHNTKSITCSKDCRYLRIRYIRYKKSHNLPDICYEQYKELYSKEQAEKELKRQEKTNYICKGREKEYLKEWRSKNADRLKEALRHRMETDELFKFKTSMRKFLCHCFRRKGVKKDDKTQTILGCSLPDFKAYIESKFKSGMSFENYGEWQIDHIIPLSTAETIEDVKRLCHYTNLQPLWAHENRSKSNKIAGITG